MIDVPVEVKDALREGTYKKNYRFVVLNEDGTESDIGTIENDNLVSESVSIDERMCSGDTLKFGLCEGSSLEFQYFGKPNITGKRVQAFVDVIYGYVEAYVSKGTVPNYNRYTTLTESGTCYLRASGAHAWQRTIVMSPPEYEPVDYVPTSGNNRTEQYLEGLKAGDRISVYNPIATVYLQQEVKRPQTYTIPMGFFDVKKCSRQASTGIIKATCYNKLQSDYLDAKANEMLFDSFTEATDVTIFDIQSILLNDYQIYQADKSRTRPMSQAIPGSTISLGDYHFTKSYGVDSIFNPCNFPEYENDGFALNLGVISPYISASNSRIDALYGSVVQLEQIFVNYLRDLIDGAELDVSFDTILNNICANVGFQNCFGVRVQTSIQPIVIEYYSTIQWDYEEAHSLPHTVGGTMQDVCKFGANGVTLYIPHRIDVCSYGVHSGYIYEDYKLTFTKKWRDGDTWHDSYKYYADAQHTEKTGELKPLIFSDGTIYTETSPAVHYDYLFWLNKYEDMPQADLITVNTETIPEFTLRDIVSASYETQCEFGQLSRVTDLFSGVELNHSRLYPADTLYPATDLYPSGAAASGFKSMYSKLWADEGNVHKWRYLIITYKGLDGEGNETDYTLQRTVNNDGTDNYNCSDNWLFRNLVWTAEQIGAYADAMVAKMQDVTWFPFEMWCAGLPYIETGDEIEIPLGEHSYTSYVLQRQLKGIQNLQDTYINGTLDIF